jgi:hypothetical protein
MVCVDLVRLFNKTSNIRAIVLFRDSPRGEAAMTKAEIRRAEDEIVRELKRVAEESPQTARLDVDFKRDWAYGNVGLENEKITREQVEKTVKE